jgi:tRNA threonylcarbamoyladenosine biosynthesis protein TsaE
MSSKMTALQLNSHSPEQTQRLGVQLGELAQAGDVFLFSGNLGSGKTCLTQGIAWGIGVKEYAFSPSFVIVREYYGRLTLYHIDFYRLNSIGEIVDLGLDEYFSGSGVCVVEWADKGITVLPQENLLIRFSYISDTERSLRLEPRGERYSQLLKSLNLGSEIWN